MEMSTEERKMWEAIDSSLPELRSLAAEMRGRGEDFTAGRVAEIADGLAGSRPHHVGGVIQREDRAAAP